MAETNGADAAAKKVVMVTGGTGLVGSGIKEFVATDTEVSFHRSLTQDENFENFRNQPSAGADNRVLAACCCRVVSYLMNSVLRTDDYFVLYYCKYYGGLVKFGVCKIRSCSIATFFCRKAEIVVDRPRAICAQQQPAASVLVRWYSHSALPSPRSPPCRWYRHTGKYTEEVLAFENCLVQQ